MASSNAAAPSSSHVRLSFPCIPRALWISLATGMESPTGMWALHGRNQVFFLLYPHSPCSMLGAQLKLEWPRNWWGHLFLHEGLAQPQSWWVVQTLAITRGQAVLQVEVALVQTQYRWWGTGQKGGMASTSVYSVPSSELLALWD